MNLSNFHRYTRVHNGEKPYSCDVCQKLYAHSNALSRHKKFAAHMEKIKNKNTNIPHTQSCFVDCGESIKEEFKEEIIEVEIVNDPLTINQEIEKSNIFEDNKEEIKEEIREEEESLEDILANKQELGKQ